MPSRKLSIESRRLDAFLMTDRELSLGTVLGMMIHSRKYVRVYEEMERDGRKRHTVDTQYIVLGSLGPQISEALATGM